MASTNIGLKSQGRGLRLRRAKARKQAIFRTHSILLRYALSLLPIVPPIPSLTCLWADARRSYQHSGRGASAGKGNKG